MFMTNVTRLPINGTREKKLSSYIGIILNLPIFWMKLIPSIAYGIGVIANIILAVYLIKYKRYRSPIFTLILSMCLADTVMCAIAIVYGTLRMPFLIGPAWLCPFTTEVLYSAILSSEYHLVVISIVRFYQLVFPLSARARITTWFVTKICIGVWIFSVTSSIPFAIFYPATEYEVAGVVYSDCSRLPSVGDWILLYLFIVNLSVPFAITAVFHIAKHCIVQKSGSKPANTVTKDDQKRETTDTRAVMIVITVYLITASPPTFLNLFQALGFPITYLIFDTANRILWLNSALNPFIYAFAAKSVRRDVLRMLRCYTHNAE